VAQVSGGENLVVKVADGGFTAHVHAPSLRRSKRARRNGSKPPDSHGPVEVLQPLLFT
jgi:hypothetical protein